MKSLAPAVVAAALSLALCGAAHAQHGHDKATQETTAGHGGSGPSGMAQAGPLTVSGAYVRPTIGRAPNTAAYLTIETTGAPDRLIGASSPAAGKVELHTSFTENGVVGMRPVEAVEVAPGAPGVLEPGGAHVMMMGLHAPLEEGAQVHLTLTFEQAGEVMMILPVRKGAGGGHGGHGGHGG